MPRNVVHLGTVIVGREADPYWRKVRRYQVNKGVGTRLHASAQCWTCRHSAFVLYCKEWDVCFLSYSSLRKQNLYKGTPSVALQVTVTKSNELRTGECKFIKVQFTAPGELGPFHHQPPVELLRGAKLAAERPAEEELRVIMVAIVELLRNRCV